MKPITILLVILSLASLACLQTAMVADIPAAPTQTAMQIQTSEPESGAVYQLDTPETASLDVTCATVTAIFSLTLRAEPSENSNAIYWLPAQSKVQVTGTVGAWWQVSADGYTGYAKADYLQESECE